MAARHEPSAAPLRVHAALGPHLRLQVQVLKRRGPAHEGLVSIEAMPPRLAAVLGMPAPVLQGPSAAPVAQEEGVRDVVGGDAGDRLRAAA